MWCILNVLVMIFLLNIFIRMRFFMRKKKNKQIKKKITKFFNNIKSYKIFKLSFIPRLIIWVAIIIFWIIVLPTPIPWWLIIFSWLSLIIWVKSTRRFVLRIYNFFNYYYYKFYKKKKW